MGIGVARLASSPNSIGRRPLGNLLRTSVIVVGMMATAFTARADPTEHRINVRLAAAASTQAGECGVSIAADGVKLTKREKDKIARIVCRADKREKDKNGYLLNPFVADPVNGNGAQKPIRGDKDYILAFQ